MATLYPIIPRLETSMRIGWHTENPPDGEEDYLVQYESGGMDVAHWTNVNPFWTDLTTDWHWVGTAQFAKVVAWYPLPEEFCGDN